MNIKKNIRVALMVLAALTATGSMVSCTDEPDAANYYTFTGEMMSDYLNNRPYYSDFKTIVERAKLMDLLATYGQYTCFLPSNDAVQEFLKGRGLSSVDQLSDADCDTIARTHLVANMYATYDMNSTSLHNNNLMGRRLNTEQGLDNDSNAVIILEGNTQIIFEKVMEDGSIIHQNDSVENGIVQPIDKVIEKSNSYTSDLLRDNPTISYFYQALQATGVNDLIMLDEDLTYDKREIEKTEKNPYPYKSDFRNEVAWLPDNKLYGFTIFVEPDTVYNQKFQEYGISTADGPLRALYDLACQIYDPVYPNDVNSDGHKFENLKDSVNPLKRFIQYHILNRWVRSDDDLTALIVPETKQPFGFETKWMNAVDWYQTLLPHTMIKVELLSRDKRVDVSGSPLPVDIYGVDEDKKEWHFLNRRYESPEYEFRGACVDKTVDKEYKHDGRNGRYFYVDDLVVFSKDVRDKVQNMRIRMDFSTVFPELMTQDLRLKGDYRADDGAYAPADDSPEPKNGKNYQFPMGFIDGVTFNKTCHFIYRRPHWEFWSWQGDEWNLFGDYDFTFRIPPVPYSGEWQVRLGFAPLTTRGVMQVYFDGIPQGIPYDMTKTLRSEKYLGDRAQDDAQLSTYKQTNKEDLAEEQKLLKNLGAYRGPRSCYNIGNNGSTKNYSWGIPNMMRVVLCQTYMDANVDHYLRFRVASEAKQGNDNEFMFDFLELVPKSVYGVDGDGDMEDDL